MAYDTFQNITIQQLEALIFLVSERNFSRAARKMFLTQPSLTKHIQKLEEAVNSRVVNRENSGITLTPEGKVLYDIARKIVYLRDDARDRILKLQNPTAGVIHLCASTIPATYIMPRVLTAFKSAYPDIHTYIISTNSDDAIEMVSNGSSDIGFVGKKPQSRKLQHIPLWHDHLALILPEHFPQANKKSVSPEELFQIPFIVREKGSATRETLDRYLRDHASRDIAGMNVVAELGSSEAVKEGIIAGLGASILSVYAVERELRQGVVSITSIDGWDIQRDFYVTYRKSLTMTPAVTLFLNFVQSFQLI